MSRHSEKARKPVIGMASKLQILAAAGLVVVAGCAASADSSPSAPSSKLLSADGSVYDDYADMCAIDLVVDVADSEQVVIQNELPGDSDRTVQNTGNRSLRTVVPADSDVLIYAVDLDANTSKRLKAYHLSDSCTLSERTQPANE